MKIDEIPIHIINLKNRIDRKQKVLKELQKFKIENYFFHEAVDKNSLDLKDLLSSNKIESIRLKKGQYACFLSHYNLYELILNKEEEYHLILEDDIYFVDDFLNKANDLLKEIEKKKIKWDIFYLGINCYEEECKKGIFVSKLGIYYPKVPIWGTHAYLIKKESIKKIIKNMIPIVLPIDVFLMDSNLKKITLLNTIIKTENIDSDTQD